jgi:hypothetical protein
MADIVLILTEARNRAGLACGKEGTQLVVMMQAEHIAKAIGEIRRLKAERDDVRREYCRRIACPLMDITDENDEDRMEWKAREIADKFKWDCFGGAA